MELAWDEAILLAFYYRISLVGDKVLLASQIDRWCTFLQQKATELNYSVSITFNRYCLWQYVKSLSPLVTAERFDADVKLTIHDKCTATNLLEFFDLQPMWFKKLAALPTPIEILTGCNTLASQHSQALSSLQIYKQADQPTSIFSNYA